MEMRWARAVRVLILAVCAAVLAVACGVKTRKENEEETVLQETEAQEQKKKPEKEEDPKKEGLEEEYIFKIELEEPEEERFEDGEGNVVLVLRENLPRLTFSQNKEAEKKWNAFFLERQAGYRMMAEEYARDAEEEMRERKREDKESGENWKGYGLGLEYTLKRLDERMISVVEDGYMYTGGAHPNAYRTAYNFDAQTGEVLSLEEAVKDLDEVMEESAAFLKAYLENSELAEEGMLFKNYDSHVRDILTDSTWYTDREGFHIICNEYMVAPHGAGILEFTLPCEEYELLKEQYRVTDNQSE